MKTTVKKLLTLILSAAMLLSFAACANSDVNTEEDQEPVTGTEDTATEPVDETPEEVPDETPDETPNDTPDETPDETSEEEKADCEHSYLLQDDSYEATDTEGGYRHYACQLCGDEYSYETDPMIYETNPKTGEAVTLDYAVNPYLPTYELMPDNEMHVFWSKNDSEWRVYTTGSHDSSTERAWCGDDVVCWSAPVYDLSDWRYEGVLRDGGWYFASDFDYDLQTDRVILFAFPFFTNEDDHRLWVNGTSDPGAYFDTPLCEEGIPTIDDTMQFDPAIYIEDDGSIYVVYDETTDDVKHCQLTKLNADRTAVEWSTAITMDDGGYNPNNYEANTFDYIEEYGVYVIQYSYEDPSQSGYYPLAYIYTSDEDLQNATWHWGGIIGDNGGFYQKNLETGAVENTGEASYSWDNNHGGLVKINGEWYLSNHRHTAVHACRQGFLEKVNMSYTDGVLTIEPTEYTSSIGNSIDAYETWQAAIACYITPAKSYSEKDADENYVAPVCYIESLKGDENNGGFVYDDPEYAAHRTPIVGIENGVTVGFKYLNFGDAETNVSLSLLVSREDDYVDGTADIYIDAPSAEKGGTKIGSVSITSADIEAAGVSATGTDGVEWSLLTAEMTEAVSGVHGVYFVFCSNDEGKICMLDEFAFAQM